MKNVLKQLIYAGSLLLLGEFASAQSLRDVCARALHEAAYAQNAAEKQKQLNAFSTNGCVADIVKAYGASGVPKVGDANSLAMAAIAYKGLLDQTAIGKTTISSAGRFAAGGGAGGGAGVASVLSADEIIDRLNKGDGGVATGAGNPAAKLNKGK